MTNKFKINIRMLALILVAVALVLAGFRTILVCSSYDIEASHFDNGNPLPDIFNYILFALTVCVIIILFLCKKGELPSDIGVTGNVTKFFAGAVAFCSLWGGLYSFTKTVSIPDVMQTRAQQLGNIQALLSLGVFIYFVFNAFSNEKHVKIKSVFGLVTILWHVLFVLTIYFDMTTPLNAPVKVLFQFAVLASMFYINYEMRFFVNIPQPRAYVAASLVSVVFLLSASVSMIVGKLMGKVNIGYLDLIYCVQLLCTAGYVLSRLFTYLKTVKEIPFMVKNEKTEVKETVAEVTGN
ncbi:MAG: hypothetical protein E7591_08705 [Ruminococcaceae bacterium]|nr:hypothetical protein [Oscillospiraceae bacterium]